MPSKTPLLPSRQLLLCIRYAPVTANRFDVAIVGMGPVGAVASLLFGHAGLKVVAIEKDAEVYTMPRAVNLDGEMVRHFQPLGLAQEVNALLQPLREGERAGFGNSRREWLFGQTAVHFGPNGWQPGNMFDQPELETYFRQKAISQPGVTTMIGRQLVAFQDHADHVSLALDNGEQLAASYLLGCDGAASFVRKTLGIGWQDLGYNHQWLVVDVQMIKAHQLPNEVMQVCDPQRIHTYVATKEPFRRWEFKLNAGEQAADMLVEEKVRSLLDPWTPRDTYNIRRKAVYEFHAATADRWQAGRVLIAGDAAHQTPPFLGQGMNAGLRDVVNLAWKLPLIVTGKAAADLLATYEQERLAHAHDLVDWAVSFGHLMEHLASAEAAALAGQPVPPPPAAMQTSGYGQGRDQPPLRAGALVLSQVSDTGLTGYLFRQPLVRDQAGNECLLDELLGGGFSIVGSSAAALVTSERHRPLLSLLGIRKVDWSLLTPVQGRFDEALAAVDALIVRPDRIVYGHTEAGLGLDDLLQQLAQALYLTGIVPDGHFI